MKAPRKVPDDSLFPNNHILNNRLTNFRMFSTSVTVNADDAEARRLTPRIQAYWVKTFRTRYASWLGMLIVFSTFCSSTGAFESDSYFGMPNGGDAANRRNCVHIDGRNGIKRGSERR